MQRFPSAPMWITVLAATTGIVASTIISSAVLSSLRARITRATLRSRLPRTIEEWCPPGGDLDETHDDPLWRKLEGFFKERGYILWRPVGLHYLVPPGDLGPTCNGFAFAPMHFGGKDSRLLYLAEIHFPNAMLRAARTPDGRDVVIRVICVGSEGHDHLGILKHIAGGICGQGSPNHAVPLFELFELEDITFGIFPRVGFNLRDAYGSWAENSVGDVVDMILQCLEALAFMHGMMLVAHRDAFKDNFLIQWFPESLGPRQLTIARPRVFLNDFETAVRFDASTSPEQRTCVDPPLCPTFALPERYCRRIPHEVSCGNPYDPFKLDVWQFGTSLDDFKTGIPEIDTILTELAEEDPSKRIGAFEASKKMSGIVRSMPAERLDIAPALVRAAD